MKLIQTKLKKNRNIQFIKNNSDLLNIKNNIIWLWFLIDTESINLIDNIIKNNNRLICGPNTLFKGGHPHTTTEKYLCSKTKYIAKYIIHTKHYKNRLINSGIKSKFLIVDLPINTSILPKINKTREKCILIYIKRSQLKKIANKLRKVLYDYKIFFIQYGLYKREELLRTANNCKCCIYLGPGESAGLAVIEILCSGCPIISFKDNLHFGEDNINSFKLENNKMLEDNKLVLDLVIRCMNLNNVSIANNARIRFNTNNIIRILSSFLHI